VTDGRLKLSEVKQFAADRTRIAEPLLGRYVVWESSGSSGEPGLFVQDAAALAVYDALEALRRPLRATWSAAFDPMGMHQRMVFVGATDAHFASNVSIERLRRLNPLSAERVHAVSFLLPPDELVAQVDAYRPTLIATYPSAAVMLAEEKISGRLASAPEEIWTGGENLTPAMRKFVADAFGCPVVDSYGASEFLALACECRHGHLHLNSDWAILESVDRHGHAVPAGTVGATTLLTNLANHVQPIIRYDLGDRTTLHTHPCECGSVLPVIEVRGRDDDMLRLGNARGKPASVLPLALCTVLEEEAGLFDFQLCQIHRCELALHSGPQVVDAAATLARAKRVLSAYLERAGACGVRIDCVQGRPLQRTRSGKVRRVVAHP
jgi:phenylacetate-coenzyme A ligase PaaK-like adenylate-forming protein